MTAVSLCAMLECVVCGRWWISAVNGTSAAGAGITLCTNCTIPCDNCGKPLTAQQLQARKNHDTKAPPACGNHCSNVLALKARRAAP